MPNQIERLLCHEDSSWRAFQVYRNNMIGGHGGLDVKQVFEMVMSNREVAEFKVLSVGTGNGTIDESLVDFIAGRFPNVVYIAVEPVKDQLQKFITLTASKKAQHQWENVRFEFHTETIENYMEKFDKDVVAFDLIHTVHCAYYFTDPVDVLLRLYQMLRKEGILVNVTASGKIGELNMIMAKYYSTPNFTYLSSEYLEGMIALRLSRAVFTTITQPGMCRINECFNEESRDGNDLLDFVTQVHRFRKNASEEILNEVLSFLKNEHTPGGHGDCLISWDSSYLIMRK